jgi:hypothetical protein
VEIYDLSYAIIPSFEINGDSLSVAVADTDGEQLLSGKSAIQFNTVLGNQIKTVSVTKGALMVDYTLTVLFAEDPDTVRSITDFRFVRGENSSNALIASDAVASIINSDRTGTINVQVLYSGAKPSVLYPRFISPGTVTVAGVTQTSRISSHSFSEPFEYRVVSRNGLYVRVYTVKVQFINLATDTPKILSFTLPRGLNRGLVQDAAGVINDTSGRISIEARYSGYFVPDTLIPEFTAQGLVTVNNSVQISGLAAQDFSRLLRYTVTNPENPLLKREYTVQCQFVRDDSSDAAITAFGFYPEDNIGLADILTARIDQGDGKITLYAPVGSGVTSRVMIPQFSASGQVSVSDTLQRSGFTGRLFDGPAVYTVVSANGQNRRDYTVDVKELGSTMYVNHQAMGLNDGTNWQNAFVSLKAACEAAALFPRDVPKEIWIAEGTYTPETTDDYFTVAPNASYIGGFAGQETSKTQRNIAANPVIILGSPAKKQPNNIHGAFFNRDILLNGEDVCFEDLEFSNFMLNERTDTSFIYNPVSLRWVSNSQGTVTVRGCKFTDVNAPCIETSNGNARLYNVNAERVAGVYNNNKAATGLNMETDDVVDNVRIVSQIPYGNAGYAPLFLFFGGERPASTLTLSSVDTENCVTGVYINGNALVINVSNLTAKNINTVDDDGGDKGSVLEIEGGNSVSITGMDIDGVVNGRSFFGTIFLHEVRGTISLENVTIKNVSVPFGDLYAGGGGICINHYPVDAVDDFSKGSTGRLINWGGRIEMRNINLQNIERRYLPVLNIYKPEADIYLNDITSSNGAWFYEYANLFAYNLNFFTSVGTFISTRSAGETNINHVTGEGIRISCLGTYVNRNNFVNNATIKSLSGSGFSSTFSINTVIAEYFTIEGYKNLYVSNATLSRSFHISSSSSSSDPTENSVLTNVVMQNSNLEARMNHYINIYSGVFSAKDSTFLSCNNPIGGDYSLFGRWTYNDKFSVYGVFDNCTFESYGLFDYNEDNFIYTDAFIYILNNGNIEFKNCRFDFNNQTLGNRAIYVNNGKGVALYLDGVSFNNFNTAAGYIMSLSGNNSYRIKQSNSSYNGSPFTNEATRTTFDDLVQKASGAVITWE